MNRNLIIGIVVVALLLILGGVFYQSTQTSQTSENEPSVTQETMPQTTPEEDIMQASGEGVMTNEAKFALSGTAVSPASVTIKVGESVTWANEGQEGVDIASAPHPQHTDYPRLNIGIIKPGESKSLTFPEAGTYRWHDHLNPRVFGSVTVQ